MLLHVVIVLLIYLFASTKTGKLLSRLLYAIYSVHEQPSVGAPWLPTQYNSNRGIESRIRLVKSLPMGWCLRPFSASQQHSPVDVPVISHVHEKTFHISTKANEWPGKVIAQSNILILLGESGMNEYAARWMTDGSHWNIILQNRGAGMREGGSWHAAEWGKLTGQHIKLPLKYELPKVVTEGRRNSRQIYVKGIRSCQTYITWSQTTCPFSYRWSSPWSESLGPELSVNQPWLVPSDPRSPSAWC